MAASIWCLIFAILAINFYSSTPASVRESAASPELDANDRSVKSAGQSTESDGQSINNNSPNRQPRRRRRATNQTAPAAAAMSSNILGTDLFCPLQCSMQHSSAWSRVSNTDLGTFENVTAAQILRVAGGGGSSIVNDTFNNLCLVYDSYANCLARCPNGLLTSGFRSGMSALGVLCDPKKTDFLAEIPCVTDKRDLIANKCNAATDDLFGFVTSLRDLFQSNAVQTKKSASTISQLCSTLDRQTNCILPTVRDNCGSRATDLLQSILKSSLANLKMTVGDRWNALSTPECTSVLQMLQDGLGTKIVANESSINGSSNGSTTLSPDDQYTADTQTGTAGSFKTTRAWGNHPRALNANQLQMSSGASSGYRSSIDDKILGGFSTMCMATFRVFEGMLALKLLLWYLDFCLW